MKKMGIFGGTFSPIHIGHLGIALRAFEQYHLDKVIFLPNGNPPHKSGQHVLDGRIRAEMVKLAIAGRPEFGYSDMEILRKDFSYTAQTLERFCDQDPDADYYFIMGADSLDYLDSWYHPERIFAKASILAARRGDLDPARMEEKAQQIKEKFPEARIHFLDVPNIDISSNYIRHAVAEGYSVRYYVTDQVADYIEEHGLYR